MAFSDPQKNINQFALGEGWHVADFGAGTGAYTLAAALAVGGDGKVYAIDVQEGKLLRIKNEAHAQGLSNVEIIRGNLEKSGGSSLGDESVDAVIVSNILFQIDDKESFATEVNRILRIGGRVLVVDWTDSFEGLGPEASHVISEESAKELFLDAQFKYEKNIDAGEHHYGIVFKK